VKEVCGWPTPRAQSAKASGPSRILDKEDLQTVSGNLAGWTTPTATERSGKGERNESLMQDVKEVAGSLAGWCTPTTPSGGQTNPAGTTIAGRRPDGGKATVTLKDQVSQVSGTPSSSPGQTRKASTGALNPEFVSWLMGFPPEWLNSAPSAMGLSRKSRQKS
jgi:hypothetical protein